MKRKQAVKIIESGKYLYPECVKFIEGKIKHLLKRSHSKKGDAIKKMEQKATEWEDVLRVDAMNRNIASKLNNLLS